MRKKQQSKLWRKVFRSAQPFLGLFGLSVVLALLRIVFYALTPKFLGDITNILARDVAAGVEIDLSAVTRLTFWTILLLLGAFIFDILSRILFAKSTARYAFKLRENLFHKLQTVPLDFFNQNKTGELVIVMMRDSSIISERLGAILDGLITNFIKLVLALTIMFFISWRLAFVVLFFMILSFLVTKIILPKSKKMSRVRRDKFGHISDEIEEIYSNQTLVHANAKEEFMENRVGSLLDGYSKYSQKTMFLGDMMWVLMVTFSVLNYVIICLMGGKMIIDGIIMLGDLQAFLIYAGHIREPIVQLSNLLIKLQEVRTSAERIFKVLETEEEIEDTKTSKQELQAGEIIFNHVDFAYGDTMVIKDFSVNIQPGTTVAIVGPTGAGKSTLINLLMRFYEPSAGEITIGGVPIQNVPRSAVRKLFGMVLQDTWLSSGTILENLTYGHKDISEEQVRKITKLTHIDHVIETLPQGYDTPISDENANLSMGEKQLVTIARVMVANPPMLILDEATSNVDTRTELFIQDALAKLMHGRTTFVIAHRLSTIVNADLILVLKDGKLIEQGKHSELLARRGYYQKLYNSQFEKGVLNDDPDNDDKK